jgi:hypothetical protein
MEITVNLNMFLWISLTTKRIDFNNPFGTPGYLIPNVLKDLGMKIYFTKY